MIWGTLKKGDALIKDGLFWICKSGLEAHFWSYSWDGFPPLVSQFPNMLPLCQRFIEAGGDRVRDFKSVPSHGQLMVARWKNPEEWPMVGMEEECAELQSILSSRSCSSLLDGDVLSWSPNPKGILLPLVIMCFYLTS